MILELAIGSGSHTLNLAKTYLKKGATIVCTEISTKMLELAEKKFLDMENEFSTVAHNKIHFEINEEYLSAEKKFDIQGIRETV